MMFDFELIQFNNTIVEHQEARWPRVLRKMECAWKRVVRSIVDNQITAGKNLCINGVIN